MADKIISKAAKPITPLSGNYPAPAVAYGTLIKDRPMSETERAETYAHILKKDLWAEFDVAYLFECPDERACIRLLGLIRTSVNAKKLIPVGQFNVDHYCNNGYWFVFKPSDIIEWAIAKDIPRPPRLQEWYEKQSNSTVEVLGGDGVSSQEDTELASTKAMGTKYEQYEKSLDALVESGVDLKTLKVEAIFNQIESTGNPLWDIAFQTFRRNVWPTYSKKKNLAKQPGRPRTK